MGLPRSAHVVASNASGPLGLRAHGFSRAAKKRSINAGFERCRYKIGDGPAARSPREKQSALSFCRCKPDTFVVSHGLHRATVMFVDRRLCRSAID